MSPAWPHSEETTRALEDRLAQARRELVDWEDRFRLENGRLPDAAERSRELRRRRRELARELRRVFMRERRWLPGALLGGSVFVGGFSFGSDGGHVHFGFFAFGLSLGALGAAHAYWTSRRDAGRLGQDLAQEGPLAEAADPRRDRLHALVRNVLRELEAAPPSLRSSLAGADRTVVRLEQAALTLIDRERGLEEALQRADPTELRTEQERLEARIAAEADPITRERLSEALGSLDEQLVHREGLRTSAGRIAAERERLERLLETLGTRLARMNAAEASSPALVESVNDALAALREQVDARA